MRLRIGYELDYDFPQPTPVISVLNVHYLARLRPRAARPDPPRPAGAARGYRDGFGNWCGRFVAPAGPHAHLHRHGDPRQRPARSGGARTPASTRSRSCPTRRCVFLLASRFCESDRMLDLAWSLFGAHRARLGAGAGGLRLRPQPHRASTTSRPARPARPPRPTTRASASAATTPTSPSPSAGR